MSSKAADILSTSKCSNDYHFQKLPFDQGKQCFAISCLWSLFLKNKTGRGEEKDDDRPNNPAIFIGKVVFAHFFHIITIDP
jgi:hypothetical protein